MTEKPPYSIPSMDDVRAVEPNGYRVVSTFSGCGGSCLGFRMAGFHVDFASEFVSAARETYQANFPDVYVDDRDVRELTGDEIVRLASIESDVDVFEGSPPCADFSQAGKRARRWGDVRPYSDVEQRTDDLFFEYARLVGELRPRVFVAENVAGLVRGVAIGYFERVKRALEDADYRVKAFKLDAQWLGVPQHRERVIFVGVRRDLDVEPVAPRPLPYRYSMREALPWLAGVTTRDGEVRSGDDVAPTVQTHGNEKTRSELLAATRLGAGFVEREQSPDEPSPTIVASPQGKDNRIVVSIGSSSAGWEQVTPRPLDDVSTTIGASPQTGNGRMPPSAVRELTEDGRIEKRRLTIAELRRICGFPDDFVLTGSYAQQWERLGRAVPPPMMRAVAETVRDEILRRVDGGG